MKKGLQKIIINSLISTLIATRVFFAVPAWAQEVPTMPPPPSSNVAVPTMPPPPSNPPSASEIPPPSDSVIPSTPPQPTMPSVSEVQSATNPTQVPSSSTTSGPTGQSNNSADIQGTSGISGTTGVSGATGLSAITDGSAELSSSNGEMNGPYEPGSVNDPANISTGAYSTNYASEQVDRELQVLNQNLADVQNKIDQISSSGFNYANLNTLDGQVFTGNSVSQLNLLNKLNSNTTGSGGFAVFNVYDTHVGDISFSMADSNVTGGFSSLPTVSMNQNTGAFSNNIADAANSFTVKEANGNDAKLVNDINIQAITGSNSASFNTGNGIVKTGDAFALGNIINLTNTNINASQWLFGVVNIFGTLAGNIILPQDSSSNSNASTAPVNVSNNATGAFSNNESNYTNNEAASFENSNVAQISGDIDVSANSGNNNSSMNTGGGYVQTGNTETNVSNSTIANINTNQADDTVWMVIVNEMGKWVGHIYGAPWGSTSASNALPISQSTSNGNPGFSTLVDNSATGAFSNNISNYESNSDTSSTNQNTASITNNITANADTGNNEAAYNTGAGVVQTGDAKAGLNIVNMANTNITAKKFVAVLVNVLGSFLGDIVTPGNSTANQSASNLLSTLSPTPTLKPVGANTSNPTPTPTVTSSTTTGNTALGGTENETRYEYVYEYYYPQDEYYSYVDNDNSDVYGESYSQQNNQSTGVSGSYLGSYKPQAAPSPASNTTRGIFLSPNFYKATESSLAAVLLSGFKWKVDHNWLTIVPFALLIFLLRRRKKYNLGKYINLNSLLEVII